MGKTKTLYQCQQCGVEAPRYLGRCTDCGAWNSFAEKKIVAEKVNPNQSPSVAARQRLGETPTVPQTLQEIPLTDDWLRYSSGFSELDRVLGGGLIPGGYLLIGGDPGIGKSTLMLQVAHQVAQQGKTVLYVAGEESAHQLKLRADRLGVDSPRILIFPETNLTLIQEEIQRSRPDLVVVDSIQSVYDSALSGAPGNVGQIKECAGQLMAIAKALSVTILLVGHVTKDGAVSGPKLLEHTVDVVLYFEGDSFRNLRILRTMKNRFGSTNEIGVFEIGETGLTEVSNPSELFLSERSYQNQPGSVIVATMEGNRPILVEIQALVGFSSYPAPRRMTNGIDLGRLHQIVAVLERRLGMDFSRQDIYVNVVGGLRIQEPAADLGVACALIGSSHDVSMRQGTVVCGEIGLTGEVRPVSHHDGRLAEAARLGFERIVLPKTQKALLQANQHPIEAVEIRSIMEALTHCLDRKAPLSHNQDSTVVDGDEIEWPSTPNSREWPSPIF